MQMLVSRMSKCSKKWWMLVRNNQGQKLLVPDYTATDRSSVGPTSTRVPWFLEKKQKTQDPKRWAAIILSQLYGLLLKTQEIYIWYHKKFRSLSMTKLQLYITRSNHSYSHSHWEKHTRPEGALSLSLRDLESDTKDCNLDLTFKKNLFFMLVNNWDWSNYSFLMSLLRTNIGFPSNFPSIKNQYSKGTFKMASSFTTLSHVSNTSQTTNYRMYLNYTS